MDNDFSETEENIVDMMITMLNQDGLYATFQMLNAAEMMKQGWREYLERREEEKRELSKDSSNSEPENPIISGIKKMFGRRPIPKMDEEQEELTEKTARYMANILEVVFNSNEFISEVNKYVLDLEYDPGSEESRCIFVATMIVMQRIFAKYCLEDKNKPKSENAEKWKIVKSAMANKMREMTQRDYRILYNALSYRRDFFLEPAFIQVNTEKINQMSDEEYVQFLKSTTDGMDGNQSDIGLAKSRRKSESKSHFVHNMYHKYVEYENIGSLEEFMKLSDTEKVEKIMSLRRLAQKEYMKFTCYSDEEEQSGKAAKKEAEKEKKLIQSPEFKKYLEVLSNLTDEQFCCIAFESLSSEWCDYGLHGNEEIIIQERLNKLSPVELIAISRHSANGSNRLLMSALGNIKDLGEDNENRLKQRAAIVEEIYEKATSEVRMNFSNDVFEVPSVGNFFQIMDNSELMEAFQKADEISQLDLNIVGIFKALSEMSDEELVEYVNVYNKKYSKSDIYQFPEDREWDTSDTIDDIKGKVKNNITDYCSKRIVALPCELKSKLKDVKDGILSDTITEAKFYEVIMILKECSANKKKKTIDVSPVDNPNDDGPSIDD